MGFTILSSKGILKQNKKVVDELIEKFDLPKSNFSKDDIIYILVEKDETGRLISRGLSCVFINKEKYAKANEYLNQKYPNLTWGEMQKHPDVMYLFGVYSNYESFEEDIYEFLSIGSNLTGDFNLDDFVSPIENFQIFKLYDVSINTTQDYWGEYDCELLFESTPMDVQSIPNNILLELFDDVDIDIEKILKNSNNV